MALFELSGHAVLVALAASFLTLLITLVVMNLGSSQRKIAHGIERKYGLRDPEFRREMGVLLGPSLLAGNRVTPLLSAISEARETITFETFIYWSGDIGAKLEAALSERARAGVRVYVQIDWVGSSELDNKIVQRMKAAGVRVHKYRPLSWYHLARLNNRTHRKLLVIDGRVAFTGGVGIADQWQGNAEDPDHFRDVHFRLEGPVVAQVQAAFNDNWMKTTGTLLNGPPFFPTLESAGELDAHMFLASPAGGSESMHLMYLLAVAAADSTIDLSAAYFVPDVLIVESLLAATKRGVKVRVLLPGQHSDSDAVRLASKASWRPLLAAGIEIFEYQPTMLHSKVLIIDAHLVSVGSTNFDVRSFRLNDEASLNIYNDEFARHMTSVFEKDLEQGRRYTLENWEARPLREKVLEKFVIPFRSQL